MRLHTENTAIDQTTPLLKDGKSAPQAEIEVHMEEAPLSHAVTHHVHRTGTCSDLESEFSTLFRFHGEA